MVLYSSSFNEKRRQLVQAIRDRGITDKKVLSAMEQLPREMFVSPAFVNRAYEDSALPIECGQTISQPYTVAYMTSALQINENDKVLEIGTGSGYQAAILYLAGARVFTIERIYELYERSRKIFKILNFNINTRYSDGSIGWREFAPYKGIIVTAAAPQIPSTLADQLAIGGRLIVPVGDRNSQDMYIVTRISEVEFKEVKADKFKFVPLIGKEGWQLEEWEP